MTNDYLAIFITFLATSLSIPITTHIAQRIGLLDIPDQRKQHYGAIPLTGGIVIFAGISSSLLITQPHNADLLIYLLCSGLILALGIIDDLKNLSAHNRLWFQALIALMMSLSSGNYIEDLGNIVGLGDIHLGLFGHFITVLAVIGAINAFNMLDGIDGLSGSIALTSFIGLAILSASSTHSLILSLLLITALLPYLIVNLSIFGKQKIFLGDAGSMLIGFSIVWLLIQGSQADGSQADFRAVTALWLIAIPLMDMTAIMIRRIRKGKSPFLADRDHLHHILPKLGLSHYNTLLIIITASITFILIGLIGELLQIPEYIMMLSFLAIFALYYIAMNYLSQQTDIVSTSYKETQNRAIEAKSPPQIRQ